MTQKTRLDKLEKTVKPPKDIFAVVYHDDPGPEGQPYYWYPGGDPYTGPRAWLTESELSTMGQKRQIIMLDYLPAPTPNLS